MSLTLTREALLEIANTEAARRKIRPVSGRVIADWIDEGLLPPAHPIGQGRGNSPVWLYPSEAGDRVRAIVELRSMGTKRATAIRLQLWTRGIDFPVDDVRAALASEFNRFLRAFRRSSRWRYDARMRTAYDSAGNPIHVGGIGEVDPDIHAIGIVLPKNMSLFAGSYAFFGPVAASGRTETRDAPEISMLESLFVAAAGIFGSPDEIADSGAERINSLSSADLEFGRQIFAAIVPALQALLALLGIFFPVLSDTISRLSDRIANSFLRAEWQLPFLAWSFFVAPIFLSGIADEFGVTPRNPID